MFGRRAVGATSRLALRGAGVGAVCAGSGLSETPIRPRPFCESAARTEAPQSIQDLQRSKAAQKWIKLNADKTVSCLVNTDTQEWINTGAGGVRRKLIERLGGEVARASTVVQFAPNSSFPAHTHGGGEEFIVLEGEWFDEWATQPKLTYVRNYIGSRHTPRIGPNGCTILVKLRQMSLAHAEPDHTQWDVSQANPAWVNCPDVPGREVLAVYASPHETVRFERWAPHASGVVSVPRDGEEVFVIQGSFENEMGEHREWSWARSAGEVTQRVRLAGVSGCLVYVKSGHLNSPEVSPGGE